MDLRVVATEKAPKAIGPYSQAIIAGGLVFCSGQIPLIPETGQILEGDAATQARQALANLRAVLEAAGSSMALVVKTTVFLSDMNDFADVNAVYAEAFGEHRPARSAIQIGRLPKDAKVEIEATAALR